MISDIEFLQAIGVACLINIYLWALHMTQHYKENKSLKDFQKELSQSKTKRREIKCLRKKQ